MCQPGTRITSDFGGSDITCEACLSQQVRNYDFVNVLMLWIFLSLDTFSSFMWHLPLKMGFSLRLFRLVGLIFQATSENGWECVSCAPSNPFNEATKECAPCPASEITGA